MRHLRDVGGGGETISRLQVGERRVHPAWVAFFRYCHDLDHSEIERLKIQGGIPVLAELTREKVKFT